MDLDYEGPPLDEFGNPIMDYDVAVLGGTLGIFYATALQLRGLKVCVVAPRELKGQDQEWNVGMDDLRPSILLRGNQNTGTRSCDVACAPTKSNQGQQE